MTKQGWIALDRSIMDSWLWKDKPFNKAIAWIDLLLLANHDDNKFLLGNELVEVKRGSFITSEKKLMERWGWGNTKVRNFLELLKSDGMIIQETTTKRSVITIVNYRLYQDKQSADKVQAKCEQSANKVQAKCEQSANKVRANTNNNDNNYNNVNNKEKIYKKESKPTMYDEILSSVADDGLRDLFIEYIKMRKMIKAPMTDRALTMLISKVNKLEPTNIDRKKKLLEDAIINNWKSVYPIRDNNTVGTEAKKQKSDLEGVF